MKRRLAKFCYAFGGLLTRIPTYRRMYEMTTEVIAEDEPIEFKAAGRHWTGWYFGYTMGLKWSLNLDPDHWDHWALEHKGCLPHYCLTCKGYVCGKREHDLDG